MGSSSRSGGPVVAVGMAFRKFSMVVSCSSSGSVVRSPIRGGDAVDVMSPFRPNLSVEIEVAVFLSKGCCSRL